MHLSILSRLRGDWTIDISKTGNVLRIYDGSVKAYVRAFGPEVDEDGFHEDVTLKAPEGGDLRFERLCSAAEGSPESMTLVLCVLQEGDEIETDILELLEMRGG